MARLHFRLPGRAEALSARLARLLPGIDRAARRRWLEEGRIRVDGRLAERIGQRCRAGARIEIETGGLPCPAPDAPSGPQSPLWLAWVDAPAADSGALALARESSSPALELRVRVRREGLAAVEISGPPLSAAGICDALARAEMPVVGDLHRGGLGVEGGPRILALEGASLPDDGDVPETRAAAAAAGGASQRLASESLASEGLDSGWPEEPAWPAPGSTEEGLRLRVSDETLRALEEGHPWILPDRASEPASAFRPGSLVRVESRAGRTAGWAFIESSPRLAARIWAQGDRAESGIPSIDARIARALARRRRLLGGEEGDAFRLVHGEADDLPGLFVDRLGALLRVLVTGRATEGFRDEALEALQRQLPTTPTGEPWSVLEVLHLDGPRCLVLDGVRWRTPGIETLDEIGAPRRGPLLCVCERGLRYWVDPGWDAPRRTRPGFGLFPDQRENRARLDPLAARGGRWLNLFAHTGAFSVSLLAAGASEVVSVDLSAPYLARLEANLEANLDRGIDPSRHRSVRIEGRRHLETLPAKETFSGIVIDPPTAATAGRRFWSLRRDLEPLLGLALGRLESGGTLLVTQNRKGRPLGLDRVLERLADRAGRSVAGLEPAPPGPDFPGREGFPEGDAFEGWLLRLD